MENRAENLTKGDQMKQEVPGVTEQVCAFMTINNMSYIEMRMRKENFLVTTVIESIEDIKENESEEENEEEEDEEEE